MTRTTDDRFGRLRQILESLHVSPSSLARRMRLFLVEIMRLGLIAAADGEPEGG
jgi:hypothetical protein